MGTLVGMFIVAALTVSFFTATILVCYIANILLTISKEGLDNAIKYSMDPLTATFVRWWMAQRRVGKILGAIPIVGIVFVCLWFIFEFCSGIITWACFISSLVVFVPLWIMFFWFRNKRFPGRVVVASAR